MMSTKRKRSSIWTHFVDNSNKKARCKHCLVLISIAGGSNGNLMRHMKAKHPLIRLATKKNTIPELNSLESSQNTFELVNIISASEAEAVPQQSINQCICRPPLIQKAEQIDRQVVKMIAKGHHDLRIVEEEEFRKLMELISECPGYKLPSRKTLCENLISTIYNEVTDEVKKKIQAASALSLSTDAWTSRNNESYIAIVAHFVDEDTKLQSALIGCINYIERHTSQNLCDFMKYVMKEWHISNKVEAIVSDNAINILAAVRLGEWQSISCFGHSLNLVVRKATKEISDILAKVKNVVEFFNRSTQAKKKLIATQQKMNLPLLTLKLDVQTRWNTTFDMLLRIIQIKDAVIATLAILRSDLTLYEEDWAIIEEVVPLLWPFYEISVEISAETNVTLSKIIIFCNLLNTFLNKHASINEIIVGMQSVLKIGMESRFKEIESNILYAECTILDPRFKTRCFRNQRACEIAVQTLKTKIGKVKLLQQKKKLDSSLGIPTSSDSSAICFSTNRNERASIWDEYDQDIKNITNPGNQSTGGIRELDKYLNEEEYLNRKEDPLQWWHQRRQLYPHVYAYVIKRFSIVATSVPCERVFSATGQILNDRRTMLSTNKVSELVFLHSNM